MASIEFGSLSLYHSPVPTPANGTAATSRESALFNERVMAGDNNSSPSLVLASPLSEFKIQEAGILSLKGDKEWSELMKDTKTKNNIGEFFKYLEETTKAIISNGAVKKGKEDLAMEMIRFLAIHIWSDPVDLKSNLWISYMFKSDLKEPIGFIVTEILGMDLDAFENCDWLTKGTKPVQKMFFSELCDGDSFSMLFKNEHLISLDPMQILVYLAMSYPRTTDHQTEEQKKTPNKTDAAHTPEHVEAPANEEPRTTVVKPVKNGGSFPLHKIILIISAVAAAVLAISIVYII